MAIEVNGDAFEKEVIQSKIPVLVDFWGPQCAPCLALMPDVEALTEKHDGKIKLVKIDASKNRRFCLNMKVLGLPTYLIYEDGKEIKRLSGGDLTIADIEESIKELIKQK